jgi:hypothetical protein
MILIPIPDKLVIVVSMYVDYHTHDSRIIFVWYVSDRYIKVVTCNSSEQSPQWV